MKRYVALKVCAAVGARGHQEAAFLRQLSVPGEVINEFTRCHRERPHVERLLDTFECQSKNGTHQVLVLEPMGRTLEHYLTFVEAPDQLDFLREAVKQMTQGLAFIHEKGVVHRGKFLDSLGHRTLNLARY